MILLCTRCGENPRQSYPSQKSTYCRECHRKRAQAHRDSNLPKVRLAYRNSKSKTLYGITLEERERRFNKQGRKCAICGTKTPGGHGWCADHSHVTGATRGIVCQSCNSMLGFAKDSIEIMLAGACYIRLHENDVPRVRIPARKHCAHCGKIFQPRKYNIYCSGACNQAAYRKRKRDRP